MIIKRPLVWLLFAYITGMGFYKFKLFYMFLLASMLAIIITIWVVIQWGEIIWKKTTWKVIPWKVIPLKVKKEKFKNYIFLYVLPILFLLGHMQMNWQMAPAPMDNAFQDEIKGVVQGQLEMVTNKGKYTVLTLKNITITIASDSKQKEFFSKRITVYSSYTSSGSATSSDTVTSSYKIGNILSVSGQIMKFNKASNPGQFDDFQYNRMRNIDYKMNGDTIYIVDSRFSWFYNTVYNIKLKLIGVFQNILPEKDAGIMIAMILGETTLLDDEIKELYQNNGISHILAISGLHISLIGLSLYKFLSKIRIPIIPTTILSVGFIFTYGILTNFSVSTNRAVVMLVVMMIAKVIGRTYDNVSAISLSALIILIQSPLQILNAGFLLSFGAILGIVLIYPIFHEILPTQSNLLNGLMLSFCVQCMTLPIILYFFYAVPTYSLIVNMIILPLSSIIILLAIIAGIFGCFFVPLGMFTIGGTHYILEFYEFVCRIATELPGNTYLTGRPRNLQIITYYIILVVFLSINMQRTPESKENHHLMLLKRRKGIILLSFLFIILIKSNNINLNVTFLDVGQGDGIFMQMPNGTTYFIDGGSSDVKSLSKYRLEPFLKSQGIRELDYAIVTHADADHVSGLKEMITEGNVAIHHVILPNIKKMDQSYTDLLSLVETAGIEVIYISKGDVIEEGKVRITCLHPSANFVPASSNGYSTVLSIRYGQFDMLLTGDIEADGELFINNLFRSQSSLCNYDVLKVAHHGSRYSTGVEFLSFVSPKIAIISYGKNNKYGHPHFQLLERLKDAGSEILTTSEQGAIYIQTDGVGYIKKLYCY